MEKISLEQVIIYDPDVIVVQEETFYDKVFSDPRWQHVKAVREKRVYLVPRLPFNWFDRPPSFMRILGLQWLMGCLYPERYPLDIVREARTFYKLFLGVDVPYGEMKAVIRK
jgi:iron complex transport system substrate-binding protein